MDEKNGRKKINLNDCCCFVPYCDTDFMSLIRLCNGNFLQHFLTALSFSAVFFSFIDFCLIGQTENWKSTDHLFRSRISVEQKNLHRNRAGYDNRVRMVWFVSFRWCYLYEYVSSFLRASTDVKHSPSVSHVDCGQLSQWHLNCPVNYFRIILLLIREKVTCS